MPWTDGFAQHHFPHACPPVFDGKEHVSNTNLRDVGNEVVSIQSNR